MIHIPYQIFQFIKLQYRTVLLQNINNNFCVKSQSRRELPFYAMNQPGSGTSGASK